MLNGVAEYDGQTWTLHGESDDRFGAIMEDAGGNIWLKSGIGGWGGFPPFPSVLEMDESLVGSPGFKPVCEALTLSWVGSIPTRLRHSPIAERHGQ